MFKKIAHLYVKQQHYILYILTLTVVTIFLKGKEGILMACAL